MVTARSTSVSRRLARARWKVDRAARPHGTQAIPCEGLGDEVPATLPIRRPVRRIWSHLQRRSWPGMHRKPRARHIVHTVLQHGHTLSGTKSCTASMFADTAVRNGDSCDASGTITSSA